MEQSMPIEMTTSQEARRELLAAVRASVVVKATPGPSAARSQDFLYGDGGMPE